MFHDRQLLRATNGAGTYCKNEYNFVSSIKKFPSLVLCSAMLLYMLGLAIAVISCALVSF